MSGIATLFTGPKKQKPDPALAAAQKRQEEAIAKQDKAEEEKLSSRKRLLRARQGTRGLNTLFRPSGELGVTFGGGPKK